MALLVPGVLMLSSVKQVATLATLSVDRQCGSGVSPGLIPQNLCGLLRKQLRIFRVLPMQLFMVNFGPPEVTIRFMFRVCTILLTFIGVTQDPFLPT